MAIFNNYGKLPEGTIYEGQFCHYLGNFSCHVFINCGFINPGLTLTMIIGVYASYHYSLVGN